MFRISKILLMFAVSFPMFFMLNTSSIKAQSGTTAECGPCTPGGVIECTSGVCCSCGACGGILYTCNDICLRNACSGTSTTGTPCPVVDVDNCVTSPSECASGLNFYIDEGCQKRRIIEGPREAACCLYYCSATKNDPTFCGGDYLDTIESGIDISTPAGIASLITTGFQLFFGAAAIYAIIIAIQSAVLLTKYDDSDAQVKAKKNMTSAVVGLVISGLALLVLQFLVNLLGLQSFDEVFRAITPFIEGGS